MTDNTLTVTRQSISLITDGDSEAARKIKMLLPYGAKLTDDNALALAAYSRLHGLDPFNGECYFLVRERTDENGNVIKREELGVYPGIRGKRKLAKQQLQSVEPDGSYRIDYMVVGPDAVGLKPQPGEISVVIQAELRDSQSTARYIADTIKLREAGIDVETTKAIMGRPPVWTGFGVVKTNELRYIKQNPITLAKKRAESDATNQRFDLPFSDDALADDIAPDIVNEQEAGIVTVEPKEIEKKSTKQLAEELGFNMPPEVEEVVPQVVPSANRPEYHPEEVSAQLPDDEPIYEPINPYKQFTVTVDQAKAVTGSDGVKYGDVDAKTLSGKRIGIVRKLGIKNISPEEKDELMYKIEAIDVLLAYLGKQPVAIQAGA